VSAEFTEREREVILACRDGLLCKEIADRLGISTHTVNGYKKIFSLNSASTIPWRWCSMR